MLTYTRSFKLHAHGPFAVLVLPNSDFWLVRGSEFLTPKGIYSLSEDGPVIPRSRKFTAPELTALEWFMEFHEYFADLIQSDPALAPTDGNYNRRCARSYTPAVFEELSRAELLIAAGLRGLPMIHPAQLLMEYASLRLSGVRPIPCEAFQPVERGLHALSAFQGEARRQDQGHKVVTLIRNLEAVSKPRIPQWPVELLEKLDMPEMHLASALGRLSTNRELIPRYSETLGPVQRFKNSDTFS